MTRTAKTRRLVERIRRLTLAHVQQGEICRALRCTDVTVRKYQKLLGLPTRSQEVSEEAVLQLHRTGLSGLQIAKKLEVSPNKVYTIYEKARERAGQGLHDAVRILDKAGEELCFAHELDGVIADGLLVALAQRYHRDAYANCSENNLAEMLALLREGLRMKRACSASSWVS